MVGTVLLALAASLCWGTADFTSGLIARSVPLLLVLLLGQGVGLLAAAVIVVVADSPFPAAGPAAASLVAGLCVIVGLGCFYRALAVGTMSIVAPIAATGVAIPVVAGVLGGNHLAAVQVAGMAAAVAGVVLASRHPGGDAAAGVSHRSAVALALGAAAAFGGYFVLAHTGARGGVPWLLLLAHITTVVGVALAVVVVRMPRPASLPRARLGLLGAAGALDFGATALYGVANRGGQLSVVAVAGSLYPVATVLLARTVLAERLVRTQALGVGLALAGVALIAA
ncbi:MAG TPA: EamA family transporter [Solirubrobacteraceae bacterium]